MDKVFTIAVPYDNGNVFQHFGKSTAFKIYSINDGKVESSEIVDTDGTGHEALGLWLVKKGVSVVVCGGLGMGALGALSAASIKVYAGGEGSADAAVESFLKGDLIPAVQANCNHHHEGGCHSHGGGCHGGCHGHGGGCCH